MNNFNIISYLANFKEGESGTFPPIPKPIPPEPAKPFYIEDASGRDNSLTLTKSSADAPNIQLEYSNDGKQWQEWNDLYNSPLSIKANSKVYLRGKNERFANNILGVNYFNCSGNYNIGGDLTCLLEKNGNVESLINRKLCFIYLFKNSTTLVNANDLFLTSTILYDNCYQRMFIGCTSLISTPKLPAIQLATACYDNMFKGCINLVTAPKLPAMQLADSCYSGIFEGCSSLVNAPELPAMQLADSCYSHMFYGCINLVTAPKLPATQLAKLCYGYMFYGCSSLEYAPALPAMQLADYCYQYMFSGCTSLTTAPELPAETLAKRSYYYMFKGCTKLNRIEISATSWDENNSIYWVEGVSASGQFIKPKDTTIPSGVNGIPVDWRVVNK